MLGQALHVLASLAVLVVIAVLVILEVDAFGVGLVAEIALEGGVSKPRGMWVWSVLAGEGQHGRFSDARRVGDSRTVVDFTIYCSLM